MKHSFKYESGRSMTEMLGVLAIIGILSIGAAAGYNYAINKHRANQILQDIRLIYQETKYPNTVQQIVNGGAFPDMEIDTQSAYEYSFTFPDLDDFIYDSAGETTPNLISVNVSGVPQTACDILLKNKPSYVLMLKANGESVWTCDQEVNELNYIFEITSDSLDYGTCSVCTGEHCFDDDLNCPEGEYCYNDTCSKCAPEYTLQTDDTCIKCSNISRRNTKLTKENCLRCNDTFMSTGAAGGCISCNWGDVYSAASKIDCETRCANNPEIIWAGTNEANGWCGNCKSFAYHSFIPQKHCEKIKTCNDNVIFYPKDANGTATTGLCTVCSTKNADGTACECPTGQFWTFLDGSHSFCRACTNTDGGGSRQSSKVECDKCPNRYYDVAKGGNDRNGACKLCPTGQVKDTSADGDGRRCIDAPAE